MQSAMTHFRYRLSSRNCIFLNEDLELNAYPWNHSEHLHLFRSTIRSQSNPHIQWQFRRTDVVRELTLCVTQSGEGNTILFIISFDSHSVLEWSEQSDTIFCTCRKTLLLFAASPRTAPYSRLQVQGPNHDENITRTTAKWYHIQTRSHRRSVSNELMMRSMRSLLVGFRFISASRKSSALARQLVSPRALAHWVAAKLGGSSRRIVYWI